MSEMSELVFEEQRAKIKELEASARRARRAAVKGLKFAQLQLAPRRNVCDRFEKVLWDVYQVGIDAQEVSKLVGRADDVR